MAKLNQSGLIKKPNTIEIFTAQQVQELVACADPVTGPAYFMTHFFHIQHPTKGAILYQPFEYQKELLDVYHLHKDSICMLSRQLGKCLYESTMINIRNAKGEIYKIPIGKFYEYEQAKRENRKKPDISKYRTN